MLFGIDLNLYNVIFEGDALEIVHTLWREDRTWSRYENLINDLKITLHGLQSWLVLYTMKETKKASHLLAKATLQQFAEEN